MSSALFFGPRESFPASVIRSHLDGHEEVGQGADPVPVLLPDPGDGFGSPWVGDQSGQQLQLGGRGVGAAPSYAFLLSGDHRRGYFRDREPSAQPEGLVVVVEEYGAAIRISLKAVQEELAEFVGPTARGCRRAAASPP